MTRLEAALDLLDSYLKHSQDDHSGALLKALVDHAPTGTGRRNICNSILKCQEEATDDQSLYDGLKKLSLHYKTGLIYPMRAKGGKTPKITEHPARQTSLEQETLLNEPYLSEAKCDPTKLKALALRRDIYRSVLSGQVDISSLRGGLLSRSEGMVVASTQAAHILSFSLATNQPEQAELWTVLSSFSGEDMALQVGGDNIDRLGNVLTLSAGEHAIFGSLDGWLEALEQEFPDQSVVTFTNNQHQLELPDPRFIAIHAACAKVIHQCGMAEHLDRILRDWEELPVLAEDGGGSEALLFALHSIAVR